VLVSILIPCRDEEEALPPLASELARLPQILGPEHFPEVVLIDDGSRDGTLARLFAAADALWIPVRVLALDAPSGIGPAIVEGARLAAGELVATMDADLAYPLEDLRRLVDLVAAGAGVATASPWTPGGRARIPLHRRLLSQAVSALYHLRFRSGPRLPHTLTCGFRVWRRELLLRCLPRERGFAATAEMLLRAAEAGASIAELASELRPRRHGRSKMKLWPTVARHLRLLLLRPGPPPP
jgi:glycosyltransferase involved in cell wall biosynthesis